MKRLFCFIVTVSLIICSYSSAHAKENNSEYVKSEKWEELLTQSVGDYYYWLREIKRINLNSFPKTNLDYSNAFPVCDFCYESAKKLEDGIENINEYEYSIYVPITGTSGCEVYKIRNEGAKHIGGGKGGTMTDTAISLSSARRIIETRFDFLDVDKIYFLATPNYYDIFVCFVVDGERYLIPFIRTVNYEGIDSYTIYKFEDFIRQLANLKGSEYKPWFYEEYEVKVTHFTYIGPVAVFACLGLVLFICSRKNKKLT